jgi:hypothetical protein
LPWDARKDKWENGVWKEYADKLKELVKNYWTTLKNVDKIVCFALGYLQTGMTIERVIKREYPRRYVQHLAADTIRQTLHDLADEDWSQKNGGQKPQRGKDPIDPTGPRHVPIIAQDPAYCEKCKEVLKNTLDIDATELCDGFLKLTENTLVVCIAPGTAIRGVICDITRSFNGPLAMLCDEIEMETKRSDGESPVDEWLKWDKWDGASSSTDKELCPQNDLTTKSMAEYSRNCNYDEFRDFEKFKGITYKESITKYSDWPISLVELNERLDELPRTPGEKEKEYEQKYGHAYQRHKAFVTAREPFFGDLNLYVKRK